MAIRVLVFKGVLLSVKFSIFGHKLKIQIFKLLWFVIFRCFFFHFICVPRWQFSPFRNWDCGSNVCVPTRPV